jgi:hypothetical protein
MGRVNLTNDQANAFDLVSSPISTFYLLSKLYDYKLERPFILFSAKSNAKGKCMCTCTSSWSQADSPSAL